MRHFAHPRILSLACLTGKSALVLSRNSDYVLHRALRHAKSALKMSNKVRSYVRNDHLWFEICHYWNGSKRRDVPDFVGDAERGGFLVLEILGQKSPQTDAKHATQQVWIAAVNDEKRFGKWSSAVAYGPHDVDDAISRP